MARRASSQQPFPEDRCGRQVLAQGAVPSEAGGDFVASAWLGPLRASLLRWLSRRLRDAHLVEDIASETVLRAWQEFREAVAWSRLWGWAVRVASNLLCGIRASVPQRRCVLGFDFEMVPARRAPVDEIELRSMVEVLEERLGVGERTTLGLLAAGVGSTSDLAALRGVSTWRVLASRARIRSAAQVLWNDS